MGFRKRYIGFGLPVVVALMAVALFAWGDPGRETARAVDPGMPETISLGATGAGLTCDDAEEPTTCTLDFDPAAEFTITVNANVIPEDGYSGFGSEVLFGGLTYNERERCDDEVVWPDLAGICSRAAGGAGQPLHGGGTSVTPPFPMSNFTGTMVELDVQCPAEGQYEVLLTALPSAAFGATYFDVNGVPLLVKEIGTRNLDLDGDGELDIETNFEDTDGDTVPDTNVPKTDPETGETIVIDYGIADALTINCGEAPPSPTATPGGPTPTPGAGDGDANGDGSANSIDAALILQYDAGLIDSLANEGSADVNQDGNINSIDAALILQFDAGLIDSLPVV